MADRQVHFAKGYWSGLPQLGPDGKVRQCVMVAARQRSSADGAVDTRFSLDISRGAGFVMTIDDNGLPSEHVLDDQAEILIDGRGFPAVTFAVGHAQVFHPGDAAAALAALSRARQIRLHSDGSGVDSGAIDIELAPEALAWLKSCAETFGIAIDTVSDPKAPELPAPRPRSPKIAVMQATPAGPAGIEDKQKIDGWDASELRNRDGSIFLCLIRRHYRIDEAAGPHRLGIFLMVGRARGFSLMVKDSNLKLPEGQKIDASFQVSPAPFAEVLTQVQGEDEIGIFPRHGGALFSELEQSSVASLKLAGSYHYDFSVSASVFGWLRACARRNAIALEPAAQEPRAQSE